MTPPTKQAVIIGAGIGGLYTAIALRKVGWAVAVSCEHLRPTALHPLKSIPTHWRIEVKAFVGQYIMD